MKGPAMTTSATVIGALRLGLEAADDRAALAVTKALLAKAPPTDDGDTESVRVLIEAVKESGSWHVTPLPGTEHEDH